MLSGKFFRASLEDRILRHEGEGSSTKNFVTLNKKYSHRYKKALKEIDTIARFGFDSKTPHVYS
jgi:hypothetical protein